MELNEQLRFYVQEAHRLSLNLIASLNDVYWKSKPVEEVAKQIDRFARDLMFTAEEIKTLSYTWKLENKPPQENGKVEFQQ